MATSVLELLSDPKCWTKNISGRDAHGNPVVANSPSASSWCLIGALINVYLSAPAYEYEKYRDAVNKLDAALPEDFRQLRQMGVNPITGFNDDPNTTHEQVLEVLRKAGI